LRAVKVLDPPRVAAVMGEVQVAGTTCMVSVGQMPPIQTVYDLNSPNQGTK
jgi:hypothetical protein